jgi:hypothetical protein
MAPILAPGLRSSRRVEVFNVEAEALDPQTVVVTTAEEAEAAENEKRASDILQPHATRVVSKRKEQHKKVLIDNDVSPHVAEVAAGKRFDTGILLGSDKLRLKDGKQIEVQELIERGNNYDGLICFDPLEPDYDGGRLVAKFYWNDGKSPGINSFAHGGRWFPLKHDDGSLQKAIEGSTELRQMCRSFLLAEPSAVGRRAAETAALKILKMGNNRKDLRFEIAKFNREYFGESSSNADGADLTRPLPQSSFPVTKITESYSIKLVDDWRNVRHILDCYGFTYWYDQITKRPCWEHPRVTAVSDNADVQFFAIVASLCAVNGLNVRDLQSYLTTTAAEREKNPVVEVLKSLVWDGKPRLHLVAKALGANERAGQIALRCFFLQACAAADGATIARAKNPLVSGAFEYVLVLAGKQGAGKTKVFRKLLPKKLRSYFCESLILRLHDKDSVKKAISNWIVELGELEATFTASRIADLKAFLSNEQDEIRAPYARAPSRHKRRTVFVATVNEPEFLHDPTGNRRFLVLAVPQIGLELSDDDIEQVWAEFWARYIGGEQWWPTKKENGWLSSYTEQFEEKSDVEQRLMCHYDWDAPPDFAAGRKTPVEILDQFYGVLGRRHSPIELRQTTNALTKHWRRSRYVRTEEGQLRAMRPDGTWVKLKADGKNVGWYLPHPSKDRVQKALSEAGEV